MVSHSTDSRPQPLERGGLTAERFVRLVKMVRLMSESPKTREALAKKLGLDLRGFYRDLELLRSVEVKVTLAESHYGLGEAVDPALEKLPFPAALLTLGD